MRCCELWLWNRIFIIHTCCLYCIQRHLFEVCWQSRRCFAIAAFRMPVNQFNRSSTSVPFMVECDPAVYCVFLAQTDDESVPKNFSKAGQLRQLITSTSGILDAETNDSRRRKSLFTGHPSREPAGFQYQVARFWWKIASRVVGHNGHLSRHRANTRPIDRTATTCSI